MTRSFSDIPETKPEYIDFDLAQLQLYPSFNVQESEDWGEVFTLLSYQERQARMQQQQQQEQSFNPVKASDFAEIANEINPGLNLNFNWSAALTLSSLDHNLNTEQLFLPHDDLKLEEIPKLEGPVNVENSINSEKLEMIPRKRRLSSLINDHENIIEHENELHQIISGAESSNGFSQKKKVKTRRKGKRARLQALARTTPEFIVQELQLTKGSGEFTTTEVIIMLFYAYKYFNDFDVYSKIRSCMNFTRSRASIRRKIEKIVAQELNTRGGLLGNDQIRESSKQICLKKFWELTHELRVVGTREMRTFVLKMQQEAEKCDMTKP